MSDPRIAVVGATGAVGREFLALFDRRPLPFAGLRLLASGRSSGRELACRSSSWPVEELGERSFEGVDLAFFSAGASISRRYAPLAEKAGARVIDNSSAFRLDPEIPLVVPEVNPQAIGAAPIVANPNCSTILLVVALEPLRRAFGLARVVVATYQAASGAGAAAMAELEEQSAAVLRGEEPRPKVFAEPCAFNVFSHNTAVDPATGRNVEEQKMIDETRKIWADPELRITATCIRVPVMRAHAEAVNVALAEPATEEEVRQALAAAPGLEIVDDRAANRFPTPLAASRRDAVLVGRIRPDESQPSYPASGGRRHLGFELFLAGDQLLKGAALNAVQIADRMLERDGR